ncbi:MAG: type II toxin-antitoxin system Phd/YefM family antitoxin [Chlamydiales bacterium]|nr:type II toxin-antitoxin system Phd/YefM family antitoxin [Chlamydiales bacterium]
MSKIRKNRTRARRVHKVWQLQEAKTRFSQLVKEVEQDGYHTITRNGIPVVVVMSKEEFDKISILKGPLLEFFQEAPLSDLDLDLERNKDLGRDICL